MSGTVLIDARWLVGGIGTYTRHLLAGVCGAARGFEVKAVTRAKHVSDVRQWVRDIGVVDAPIYTLREQIEVPLAAKGCDLLHVPHYNAPLLHRGALLISIHDMIPVTDPAYRGGAKAWVYARPMLRLAARKAQHIVTVSEYSRAQIVERLKVPASKITTIYNGVNGEFHDIPRDEALKGISESLGVVGPYILYVGSLKPYKNVSGLLRAYALLRRRRDFPYKLLIVGDDVKWRKPLLEERSRLGLEGWVRFIPFVDPKLLPKVYAAATVLVMPSRIEGFGLPVLEAMASGTPVVSSNAASLPEVGGDAVAYFDASSEDEMAAAIERVLNSRELQQDLRTKGVERAKRFTWQESARKHIELYQELLGTN